MRLKHLIGSKWTRHLPPRPEGVEDDPHEDRRCHFVLTALHQKANEVTMHGVLGGADLALPRDALRGSSMWTPGWSSPSELAKPELKSPELTEPTDSRKNDHD